MSDEERWLIGFQSVARGWLTRRSYNAAIRRGITEKLELFTDLEKSDKIIPLSTEILRMGRHLMSTFRSPDDRQLLARYCRLIIISMDSPKDQNIVSLFLNRNTIAEANRLISSVIVSIPEILKCLVGNKVSEVKMWQTFIHFLLVFSSANSWSYVKSLPQVQTVLNGLCQKMSSQLYSEANFRRLSDSLFTACNEQRPLISVEALNALFCVLFRPIREASDDGNLLHLFVTKTLTHPALILHLNKTNRDAIVVNKVFDRILSHLRDHADIFDTMEPQKTINLMGNIIHLGHLDEETTKRRIVDWTWVLGMAMAQCTEYAVKPGEKSSHNHWHPIFGNYRLPIDQKAEGALKNVVKQLQLLWSANIVSSLFDMCLTGKSTTKNETTKELSAAFSKLWKKLGGSGSENGVIKTEPPSLTAVVCKVYVSALSSMPHLKSDIISGLCHNDQLLRRLWAYLVYWGQSSIPSSSDPPPLTKSLRILSQPDSPHAAPLHLFAEAAAAVILILDEEEMYDKGIPFSFAELISIAKFCNWFCFRVIWNGVTSVDHPEGTLFGAIHSLTLILYSRDCRRQFASNPKFWHSPDVKSTLLINEYEKKTQRGVQLMEKLSHCISLRERMLLFRKFVTDEKATIDGPPALVTIVRTRIIEDGYRQLSSLTPRKLKSTIRVKFVNQQGLEEAGIDQDGVFKEFLEITLKQVFAPSLNLFTCTSAGVLYPSATSYVHEDHLALFSFIGRMLAKAIYEGIVVDVQLAPVLLSAVLGGRRLCAFDELAQLDHELYKNLTFVKRYEGDVADLALTFSTNDDYLGKVVTTDLIAGGRSIQVTNENKIDYIHRMAHHRVFSQTRQQCKAFVIGMQSILNAQWLSLFAPHELQYLISGQSCDIDVTDLKKNVQYFGGFHSSHRVIKWLWEIVENEFSVEERKLFLKFVTSCSKPPLLGFSYLEPPFAIRCVEVSDDQDQGDTLGSVLRGFLALRKNHSASRLPTASTCFNLLKLPNYNKKSVLLSKLRYAIHAESGFELS